MSEAGYAHKLDEVDRLLNDPEQPLDPAKVWSLLADIAGHSASPCNIFGRSPKPVYESARGNCDA
jgi:hypothetical protein